MSAMFQEADLGEDDTAVSRSRSRRRHPSPKRDEMQEHARPLRTTRTRTPTPFPPSTQRALGVVFAIPTACVDSHASPTVKRPAPCSCARPADTGVQLPGSASRNDDEVFDCGDQVPRRSLRARIPTPFQHGSTQERVRFGLTTLVDEEVPTTRPASLLDLTEVNAAVREHLRERVSTPPASDREPIEMNDAEEELPRFRFNRRAFDDSFPSHRCSGTEECAVCHDALNGEDAKLFPCGHVFHNDCIWQWFQRQPSCPLCRRSFRSELGGRDAESIPSHPLLDNIPRVHRDRRVSI